METKINFIDRLQKNVIPGINLFELILFTVTTVVGGILFILTLTIWNSDSASSDWISNLIAFVDIPIGIIAATFLAKRSKLAPMLLSIDALLYGSANFIAGQIALGFVNCIATPIIYLVAYFYLWPKQEKENSGEVVTKKFNLVTGLLFSGSAILLAVLFGVVITLTDGKTEATFLDSYQTWFDSFAAALMLMAVITSTLRFREGWYFYFVSNILKIALFSTLVIKGDYASLELLVIAIAYLINATFAMFIWKDSEIVEIK